MLIAASVIIYRFYKSDDYQIKPLDQEFNARLEFGVQYYIISGNGIDNPEKLAVFIERYLNANASMFSGAEMILFYEHSYFNSYESHMYESAKDNEFGGIEGFQKSLIAKVWSIKLTAGREEHLVIYKDGKMAYQKIINHK